MFCYVLQRTSIERHHLCFDQRKCSRGITLSDGGKRAEYKRWFGEGNVTTTDGYTTGIHQWQIKIHSIGFLRVCAGVSVLPRDGDYSTESGFFGRSRAYYWNASGDSFHCEGGVGRQLKIYSKCNEGGVLTIGDVLTFILNCEKSTLEVYSSSSHNTATITGVKLGEPLYPTVCLHRRCEVELC